MLDDQLSDQRSGERPDDSLDLEHAARLDDLAAEYRREAGRGGALTPEAFADRHADVRDELLAVLRGMALLDGRSTIAGPLGEGQRVGPYVIRGELGRGGMGVVYEAVEEELGRVVALKALDASQTNERFRARFQREARAAARLDHPGIVPVYGSGEDGPTLWYAMRRVSGVGLDRVLSALSAPDDSRARREAESTLSGIGTSGASASTAAGTPAQRAAASIAMRVAEALAYAHAAGVLHRDVKPANVMLDRDGAPHLTDFGLCKLEGDASLTVETDIVGTLRYLPPEALHGSADARGDVYGAGLVLYELLARRPAFKADDRASMLQRILHEDPTPLSRIVPDVPDDLAQIVAKATAKLPEERYASANGLARDLSSFLSGRPVEARAPSRLYLARLFVRRNRALVSAVIAVFVALVAGVVGTSIGFVRAVDARDVAEANATRASTELAKAEQVTAFLRRLLDSGSPWFAAGRDTELLRDILDEAAATIDEDLAGQPEAELLIRTTIGSTYRGIGDEVAAAPHFERAFALAEAHLPPDDPAFLAARRNMGWSRIEAGDPDAAEALFRENLRLHPLDLAAPDPDALSDFEGVLGAHEFRFDWRTVVEETEEVLPAAIAHLGPETRVVQELRESRINALISTYRFEEARVLAEEHLDHQVSQYGEEHPYTLSAIRLLGFACRRLGQLDRAEALYRRHLAGARLIFGESHELTDRAKNSVALLLRDRGQYDEALALLEEVLESNQQKVDETHKSHLVLLFNLSVVQERAELYDESVETMQRRYELHVDAYGPLHEQTLLARVNLAVHQMHAGRVDESLGNYAAAVEGARSVDGFDRKFLGFFLLMNGQGLLQPKRFEESEALLLEAWDIFLEEYSEESGTTREAALTLVRIYEGMGRDEDAEVWRGVAAEVGPPQSDETPER
ncbi:MAG: serine/threonine-protein kinase [Planctomycetota bacterium]